MFNKDFYPTPVEVLDQMQIDCFGKIVLEPSAGKGDIIDWLKDNGAKKVIFCENNKDLIAISGSKAELVIEDFLSTVNEQISHIDMIVMNPPFSADEKHLLHAWKVAPPGCEIISLINNETYENAFTGQRRQLKNLISNYGVHQNMGNVFSNSERKTNVEIGLVKLFKPIDNNKQNFDDFFTDEADEEFGGENGILPHNKIRELVQRYIQSIEIYKRFEALQEEMNATNIHLNLKPFKAQVRYGSNVTSLKEFSIALQKESWQYAFNLMNLNKFLTQKTKADMNAFIETQTKYPFTMKNIFRMVDVIVGTREQTLQKALVEAVDHFTKYAHENRFDVEGWKTNSGYMLNKKFIINYISQPKHTTGVEIETYKSNYQNLDDLLKVMCFLTGNNYDDMPDIKKCPCEKGTDGKYKYPSNSSTYPVNYNTFETNKWYDWQFFTFKLFKKGTMHIKFKDLKEWELINKTYAKIKGQVLPETIKFN